MPAIAIQKTQQRLRRHNAQVADLNMIRDELYMGSWDGQVYSTYPIFDPAHLVD